MINPKQQKRNIYSSCGTKKRGTSYSIHESIHEKIKKKKENSGKTLDEDAPPLPRRMNGTINFTPFTVVPFFFFSPPSLPPPSNTRREKIIRMEEEFKFDDKYEMQIFEWKFRNWEWRNPGIYKLKYNSISASVVFNSEERGSPPLIY